MNDDSDFVGLEELLRERSDPKRNTLDPDVMQRLIGKPQRGTSRRLELEAEATRRGYNPYDRSR